MIEIFLPTIRWDASIRGLLGHLHWMSREFDVLVSVSDDSENPEKHGFLAKLSDGFPRFRVTVNVPRLGMFRNFSALFQNAARPYGLLLGDDDWLAPDYVLGAQDILQANPQVSAVMGLFLHVLQEGGARIHPALNIAGKNPASRISQYLSENDGYNHPLFSVVRTSALQQFCGYVDHHPLIASFFDYLVVYSYLAHGGLVSHGRGPYIYVNSNWSTPERARTSNVRSYVQLGLPEWFADFHTLYRGVEGFSFLRGSFSPIHDPNERYSAAVVVLQHYLTMFRKQLSGLPAVWWDALRNMEMLSYVEPFATKDSMNIADVQNCFLEILRCASTHLHKQYAQFQGRQVPNAP